MKQPFFEFLNTNLYPVELLHFYGVNGKVSGSVSAVGEIGGKVVAVVHGPMGCGFHYRHSGRRRHQPFYQLLSSDLTEQEIIFGGEEKLYQTAKEAWERYRPEILFLIPTPVSDILNDNIHAVAELLRKEGIFAVEIQSELFSHRDKNYARNRLRQMAKQKITGDNRMEVELKGCGFTEALYAMVDHVMEPQERIARTINIETIAWGSDGNRVLREMEQFLSRCKISINTWIPSASVEELRRAPAAQLNLAKRIRWAKHMKERFDVDYLFLGNSGRYMGLEGISRLYRDIAEKLDICEEMEREIAVAEKSVLEQTMQPRKAIGTYRCVLVCKELSMAPFWIKLYAKDFGIHFDYVCLVQTQAAKRSLCITPEMEAQLLNRIEEAISMYSSGTKVVLNASKNELSRIFSGIDAVLGTNDATLEGMGAPIIPSVTETVSLSYESYIRNVYRLEKRLKNRKKRELLLLNQMEFNSENYPRYENRESIAARGMWEKMWLERKEAEHENSKGM